MYTQLTLFLDPYSSEIARNKFLLMFFKNPEKLEVDPDQAYKLLLHAQ